MLFLVSSLKEETIVYKKKKKCSMALHVFFVFSSLDYFITMIINLFFLYFTHIFYILFISLGT